MGRAGKPGKISEISEWGILGVRLLSQNRRQCPFFRPDDGKWSDATGNHGRTARRNLRREDVKVGVVPAYGMRRSIFEGLKAFRGVDGKVRLRFLWGEGTMRVVNPSLPRASGSVCRFRRWKWWSKPARRSSNGTSVSFRPTAGGGAANFFGICVPSCRNDRRTAL